MPGSSSPDAERARLLGAFAETGDPTILDALAALESAPVETPEPVPAERLVDVLDRLREQTDPGRREAAPTVEPAQPGRGGWKVVMGVAAALALATIGALWPESPSQTGPQLRGAQTAEAWPDSAQMALQACCHSTEPVRARVQLDAEGQVVKVQLLGADHLEAEALRTLQVLEAAPLELRGASVDIWVR